jgi:palmitoyltransferase ZDHHC9/14/18
MLDSLLFDSLLLQRNYRFYLLLMCSALAFYAFILTFSVTRIRAKSDAANGEVFIYLVTTLPETFALAALSFMAVCVLACLLASHAFFVAKNKVRAYTNL